MGKGGFKKGCEQNLTYLKYEIIKEESYTEHLLRTIQRARETSGRMVANVQSTYEVFAIHIGNSFILR